MARARVKAAPDGQGRPLTVSWVPIASLNPAPYNPRRISPDKVESLKASIREFGFVDPAIVNLRNGPSWPKGSGERVVVGGHQRLRAAAELGWSKVPVVFVDVDATRERLMNLALNNPAGEWDPVPLASILRELEAVVVDGHKLDLTPTGFSEREVQQLFARVESELGAGPVDPEKNIHTTFRCPSCKYEWTGKPR